MWLAFQKSSILHLILIAWFLCLKENDFLLLTSVVVNK